MIFESFGACKSLLKRMTEIPFIGQELNGQLT
jgi:hypothetical protein